MALKTDNLINSTGSKTGDIGNIIDGTAKAWVSFNGTGTPSIRRSFNVSSITDNGVGTYTVNFTTPLPDANYSAVTGGGFNLVYTGSTARSSNSFGPFTSGYPNTLAGGTTAQDAVVVDCAFFS